MVRDTNRQDGTRNGKLTNRRSVLRAAAGVGGVVGLGSALTGNAAAGDFDGNDGDCPIPDDFPLIAIGEFVVGFTWDSDKGGGVDSGWNEAVGIARQNGPKLAQWIADHNDRGGAPVRIIGHSLGARVTAEALSNLRARGRFNAVESVTLLGGAIDDQEVETDDCETSAANGRRWRPEAEKGRSVVVTRRPPSARP